MDLQEEVKTRIRRVEAGERARYCQACPRWGAVEETCFRLLDCTTYTPTCPNGLPRHTRASKGPVGAQHRESISPESMLVPLIDFMCKAETAEAYQAGQSVCQETASIENGGRSNRAPL